MSPAWEVEVATSGREVYEVEAETAEAARQEVMDGAVVQPVVSEVTSVEEVLSVRQVDG